MEAHLEPVQVSALAEEVAGIVEPLAKTNGNVFIMGREGLSGTMYADVGKFRQSLLNLLSNACKFTENGTIALHVTRETSEGVDWVNWRVTDTGIGIAPQDTQKLFQAFTQVDASTTRKHGGTGLGLAISQRLCQMMGGRITVESELGKGSVFTIHMPAAIATPLSDTEAEASAELARLQSELRAHEAGAGPDGPRPTPGEALGHA